jgi:hypothetical protein
LENKCSGIFGEVPCAKISGVHRYRYVYAHPPSEANAAANISSSQQPRVAAIDRRKAERDDE